METITFVKIKHKFYGWERFALVGNSQTRYGLMLLARNEVERWDHYDFKTLKVLNVVNPPALG